MGGQAVHLEGPAPSPPAVRWAFEPARAVTAPHLHRLERAAFRRGWLLIWDRWDFADGFTTLKLSMFDDLLRPVKHVAFTRKSDSFDEGLVAEGVAEWIMEPREVDASAYRPQPSNG